MHFQDILNSISRIESFVGDYDFAAYERDPKTRSAVKRQLQIVTEAAYRPGDDGHTLCPGPNRKGLMRMGNILRQSYHRVNDKVIWDTVQIDLPLLKWSVSQALAMLPAGDSEP